MKILNQPMQQEASCCAAVTSCCSVIPEPDIENKNLAQKVFSLEIKFIFCLVFTLPLLMHMFLPWHFLHNQYVQLSLATPVFIVGLLHFGKSAIRSLKAMNPNMDVLIALGSIAAYFYSLAGTIFGLGENYLFYESSASIFTIVLFGNLLEKLSVKKTSSAITELSRLQKVPAKRIVTLNGSEKTEDIDSTLINIGDILIANTGDKIPTDSKIIQGTALIDESMVTGESLPVRHETGAEIIGGTIITDGSIRLKAEKIGTDTFLSGIIKLVKDAQLKKPQIQRTADKVSRVFVPFVVTFSLITFFAANFIFGLSLSASLLQAIAVLVIACPCAMGLATPAAVMVGVGRAVKHGMLIKDASTLEKLAGVKTIIFDKTGTLTNGKFKITNISPINCNREYLESVICSIEKNSSHPLAQSVVRELAHANPVEITQSSEEKGIGIHATDNLGNKFTIGSYAVAEKLTTDNSHNIYAVKNGELIGTLDLEDEIKPESPKLIKDLHELGLKTVILSGDSPEKCKIVADKLGISTVYAQRSPIEKLEIIDELQKDGLVAFTGDGINDAPALSKAAVGISMSSASQVAIQTAQLLLVGGKISQLADSIVISRKTFGIIKQNLFWAFIYNVIALPVAAFGFLTPTFAAFAMSFSDVIIIINSLRLKTFKLSR